MADDEGVVQSNSEGDESLLHYPDAPVVESPPLEEEVVKLVPPKPVAAVEGPVARTAGPSAQATLEANVGITVGAGGVPDGALGHHAENENEPLPTSFTRHQAELAAEPTVATSKTKATASK